MPDLADRFDHTLLRTNNTKLDFEKLKLINQRMIHDKASDPEKLPGLLDQVKATLGSSCHFEDDEVLAGHLKWLSKDGRIQTFPDLNGPNLAFLWSGPKNIEYSGKELLACFHELPASETFALFSELQNVNFFTQIISVQLNLPPGKSA